MFKYIITTTILLSFLHKTTAQHWLGVAGSNYAGTNALYQNPANVVDSRYKVYVNLVSNDIFATNNYLGWDAPYSYTSLLTNSVAPEYRNSQGVTVFRDTYLNASSNSSSKSGYSLADSRGPSVLYTINDKRAVALTTRVRTGASATGISASFAELMYFGINSPIISTSSGDLSNALLNINSYAEVGVSYGQVITNNEEEFIKLGITAKRLAGIYSAYSYINKASYQLVPDPNDPTNQILRVNNIVAEYGYTKEESIKASSPSFPWLLGGDAAGGGWGLDIGVVYEYRPNINKFAYREKGVRKFDASKNKYLFKIGVSLHDIGYINYNNTFYANQWKVRASNIDFSKNDFINAKGFDNLFTQLNTQLGVTRADFSDNFSTVLPTTLQINADYLIKPHIYVGALLVQNLTSTNALGLKSPSLLGVTPRYETKWIDVAMPLVLFDNYSKVAFGLAGRLGPLFLGTDNLGSLLNIGKPKGFDFYFGLNIPIFRKPPETPNACWYEQPAKKSLKEKLMFWKRQ